MSRGSGGIMSSPSYHSPLVGVCTVILLLVTAAVTVGRFKHERAGGDGTTPGLVIEEEDLLDMNPTEMIELPNGNMPPDFEEEMEDAAKKSHENDADENEEKGVAVDDNKSSFAPSPPPSLTLQMRDTYAMAYSLTELANRGNWISRGSMCSFVRWFVGTFDQLPTKAAGTCARNLQKEKERVLTDIRQLSDYDTIFVPVHMHDVFIEDMLPQIEKEVIVFTRPPVHDFDIDKAEKILDHPKVIHMFSLNPWRSHPKLSGFPLGLKGVTSEYIHEFQRDDIKKDSGVFVSYILKRANKPDRESIPSGPKLSLAEYLREMHRHEYVLSPNGDHPDCHRHWEAIGLGTIPITMLEREIYGDMFDPAPVVYAWPLPWNATEMEHTLPHGNVRTNRRMVFQEYWYEYMEAKVGGVQLNWNPRSFWTKEQKVKTREQKKHHKHGHDHRERVDKRKKQNGGKR